MGLTALLAIDQQAPVDIAGMAVEVATEMALDDAMDITITVTQDGRIDAGSWTKPVDLVHVIGTTNGLHQLGRTRPPLVLTPTRHPSRRGGRRRSTHADSAWWLVHGRSAALRIVQEGIAPSSRMLPLPLLPYLGVAYRDWPERRASARRSLGVVPGSRVIVGMGPVLGRFVEVFRQAVRGFSPHEVVALWIATDAAAEAALASVDLVRVVGEPVGSQLLAAMDVLVVMGTPYAARSAAVDAAAVGVPVITSPFDAAADYVDLVAGGSFLITARPVELTAALTRACGRMAHTRSHGLASTSCAAREDLVALTRRCYTEAIGRPLSATTTLLNGRST